jgi:hypothetical protein
MDVFTAISQRSRKIKKWGRWSSPENCFSFISMGSSDPKTPGIRIFKGRIHDGFDE